ncbi:MAG: hypothetical protein Q9228_006331, partial [Teloschistes exilis]
SLIVVAVLIWSLFLPWTCLATAGPALPPATVEAQDNSLSHERRQVDAIISGVVISFLGVGIALGRLIQYTQDLSKTIPGLNRAPGSACYKAGPWTKQQPVAELIDIGCNLLALRAMTFLKVNDTNLANPNVSFHNFRNGTRFRDEDGKERSLTFLMVDLNGPNGALWYGKDQCTLAMQTLLYDCVGDHADTRGGMYYFGHDGVCGKGLKDEVLPARHLGVTLLGRFGSPNEAKVSLKPTNDGGMNPSICSAKHAKSLSIIASILSTAGAGFRLSLVLNAVGVEMATADVEIQSIARAISEYAFTLKQLALTLEAAKSIATQAALETAKQIADQSQVVFDDFKEMTELDQKTDERGHLRAIAIAQRMRWCFKKQRVKYLLGQLDSLKLSLSLMTQVLQMGQLLVNLRYASMIPSFKYMLMQPNHSQDPSTPQPSEQTMLQERAEIQNMVVVRHWSFVELHRLYDLAQQEDEQRRIQHHIELPPTRFDGITYTEHDPRLQIEAPKNGEDMSRAMVKFNETPLNNLDESLSRAMYRPNRLLRKPGDDIVDLLLDEWTRARGTPTKKNKGRKHRPRYDTQSEDSEIDFERSHDIGGRHIGPPPRKPKNVHFERAHVESGSEESDHHKPRHRPPRHAILDSDSVSTSTTESDSDSPSIQPLRRQSDSSKHQTATQELANRNRRPYPPAGDNLQPSRPGSRNGPPGGPLSPRPGQQGQTPFWAGGQLPPQQNGIPAPSTNGLRPPPYPMPPPGPPKRMSSSSAPFLGGLQQQQSLSAHNTNITPGTSPNTRGMFFSPPPSPQVPPPQQSQQQQTMYQQHPISTSSRRHKSSKRRNGGGSGDKNTFKENAKRDVKRGLIGAGAVAGLMDIIEGLGAI